MKIGPQRTPALRWSKSAQKLLLVLQYELLFEDHEMTQLGKDTAAATLALKTLLTQRDQDKATIQTLQQQLNTAQTQLTNTIPTDAETNQALADFSTEVAAIPADVLTPPAAVAPAAQ